MVPSGSELSRSQTGPALPSPSERQEWQRSPCFEEGHRESEDWAGEQLGNGLLSSSRCRAEGRVSSSLTRAPAGSAPDVVTIIGNMVIIVIVSVDKRLQSPMYFFLGHLSALEIMITSLIVPAMLWGLLLPGMQTMSLAACVAQLFLYLALGTTEFVLKMLTAWET
ncbi:hypothetical protein Celaphus_00012355 [Cervus elaphus hippelaphus]|uniref:G-protein coupled receptors family 1 profile domain-containing protein n=1 Tax=Cervus elaphus hippelaphus TaxID=46360 RepID=A0A212CK23_CEREH|nr:hypothetical protein Celaphus_00012355 [Cervus elaphus hippelaphus]